jgi:hypothetical protein
VGGDVKDVGVVVERLLRSIAVMHVPVDDRDAVESARARVRGCNGGVVEETEAHGLVRASVVTGRPHQRQAALDRTVEHGVHERHGSARGQLCDRDALRPDERVRVDVPVLPTQRGHPRDEVRIVHSRQLLFGHGSGFHRSEDEPGGPSCPLDGGVRRVEALGALRVVGARAVLEKPRVREEKRVSHGLPQSSDG